MFEFVDCAYYTRRDIQKYLRNSGIRLKVDTFLARLKVPKVFKELWRGREINAAYSAFLASQDHPSQVATFPQGGCFSRKKTSNRMTDEGIGISPTSRKGKAKLTEEREAETVILEVIPGDFPQPKPLKSKAPRITDEGIGLRAVENRRGKKEDSGQRVADVHAFESLSLRQSPTSGGR